jgi:hypothetical protein
MFKEPRLNKNTWENQKIKTEKYLDTFLPASEQRINTPMLPQCEVSLVVPVYGERKHILHLLKSLTEQVTIK